MLMATALRSSHALLFAATVAAGCSSGGAVIDGPDDASGPTATDGASGSPVDMAVRIDAAPPPDLMPMALPSCSWRDRFVELYHHPFSAGDVAFVTSDGKVYRGTDKLDFVAQKARVPDTVTVKGSTSPIREIRLLAPMADTVLASHAGPYIYGLGYAIWLEVNGSGEAGLTDMTLLRQFSMDEPAYPQLVGMFRVLTKLAESRVVAGDVADFRQAAAALMQAIESGRLTFAIGTGHAADYGGTAQTVNGKRFSFQLSDGFGLDPQLGFQRDGVWGPIWLTYGPSGGWSASQPGMQPKCGGCLVDHFAGATYQFCEAPTEQAKAELFCQRYGGHLATVDDLFANSFLRSLSPYAGGAYIGLSDVAMTGSYVWATGKPANFTDWAPGQPDHYMNQEHCVQLVDNKTITQWNDVSCTSALGYLCQLP